MRACFRQLVVGALIGCLALTSCRPAVKYEPLPETGATLEGTLTYGSEKVSAAVIIVAGKEGAAVQGTIGENGRYVVQNAPLGEVRIGVNTVATKVTAAKTGHKVVEIPGKYIDPTKSGITTTVNSGSNTFDIVIPK